jgi:type IV pilus biogenesis protein PilP
LAAAELAPTETPVVTPIEEPVEAPETELALADPAIDPTIIDDVPESQPDVAEVSESAPVEAGSLPTPTELAASLTDRAPQPRPGGFVEQIEQDKFGGRTKAEMESLRPGRRPQSAQALAAVSRAESGAPDNAIKASAAPRLRPQDFDAIVAAAIVRQQTTQQAALLDFETPDTSSAIEAALAQEIEDDAAETAPQNSPRLAIPSNASVARQATVEDAIRLNRLNLVGVYGLPSDRRALLRLPSGRYVKVKVGDRVDGGTVAAIGENELRYNKGGRTLALTLPAG